MCATFPAHLILLDVVTLVFGESYKVWTLPLCTLLQPGTYSSILGINILSPVFSNILNLSFP